MTKSEKAASMKSQQEQDIEAVVMAAANAYGRFIGMLFYGPLILVGLIGVVLIILI